MTDDEEMRAMGHIPFREWWDAYHPALGCTPRKAADNNRVDDVIRAVLQDFARPDRPVLTKAPVKKSRWPGLVFWLGSPFFRVVGYASILTAGLIGRAELFGAILLLVVGHLLITAGEAIAQIEQETHGK